MGSKGGTSMLVALRQKGVPMRLKGWQAGESLFAPGDPADCLFIVQAGYVRLYRLTGTGKEVLLRWCGAGDLFGEESLVTPVRRHFAEGVTKGQAWQVSAQEVTRAAERDPSLKTTLLAALNDALGFTEEVVAVVAEEVPVRLVKALSWLADQMGVEDADGLVSLPLTHAQLASLVGASRECVTVHLRALREAGVIVAKRGKLLLRLTDLRRSLKDRVGASR